MYEVKAVEKRKGQNETVMVSVIIPVYNAAGYIERCVRSVLDGKYQDFEMIIVNDGSTDDTPETCNALAAEDDRIRIYTQANMGVSASRNKGLDLAKGKYIAFIDADDYVDYDYLDRLVTVMEEHDLDWSACAFWMKKSPRGVKTEQVDKKMSVFDDDRLYKGKEARKEIEGRVCSGRKLNLFSNAMGLYRRGLIEENGLRMREDISYGEDRIFNLETIKVIKGFGYINDALYYYVQHPEPTLLVANTARDIERVIDFVVALDGVTRDHKWARSHDLNLFMSQRLRFMVRLIGKHKKRAERKELFDVLERCINASNAAKIYRSIPLTDVDSARLFLIALLIRLRAYRMLAAVYKIVI